MGRKTWTLSPSLRKVNWNGDKKMGRMYENSEEEEEVNWELIADACVLIPDFVIQVIWDSVFDYYGGMVYHIDGKVPNKEQFKDAMEKVIIAGSLKTVEGLVFAFREIIGDLGLIDLLTGIYIDGGLREDFYEAIPKAIKSAFIEIADEILKVTPVPFEDCVVNVIYERR